MKNYEQIKKQVNTQEVPTKLGSSYENDFKENTDNYGDISLTVLSWLQKLSARKLWAKRPLFSFTKKKQEKIWNKAFDKQRVLDLLFNVERKLVQTGKCYLVVEPGFKGSDPVIAIATFGNHIKRGNVLTKANIFTTILNGEYTYNINEIYTLGNVKRSITREGADIDGSENISIDKFRELVGISLVAEESFDYPIPVVVIENIPTESGNGEGDLDSLGTQLLSLQKIWNRIQWELDVNRTVIIVDDSQAGGGNVSSAKTAAFNKLVGKGIIVEKSGINAPGESNTSIAVANLQLDQAWKAFGNMLGMIFEICGYKRNSDDKGTVQQNDLEIQQVRDSEITAFTMKERTRQNALLDLIVIFFAVGQNTLLDLEDVSVDIQYMSVKNETQMLDNLEKAMNLNLISQVDAIAQFRNITTKDAEQVVEEIKKEKEENQALLPMENTPESNIETDTETETPKETNNETNI